MTTVLPSPQANGQLCLAIQPPLGEGVLRAAEGVPTVQVVSAWEAEPRRVLLPPGARAAVRAFPNAARVTWSRAEAMLAALADDLGHTPRTLDPGRHLLLLLSGDAGHEEVLAAALASSHVPLVGGSFEGLHLDGGALEHGAVVCLIETSSPFRAFLVHPFVDADSASRVVVTACQGRRLLELDGLPAAPHLAGLLGCEVGELPASPHHLGWFVGGHLVPRPVIGVDGDTLLMGGAVERGSVLRVVSKHADPAARMAAGIQRAAAALPVPRASTWVLACDRMLSCPDGPRFVELAGLEDDAVVLGAGAQQFGPVHTCSTIAGIVWGRSG